MWPHVARDNQEPLPGSRGDGARRTACRPA